MAHEDQKYDYKELNRLRDKAISTVFMGNNAAFLGPLLCTLNFIWSEEVPTAGTNGIYIKWNPAWFLTLNEETRKSVLLHELWHVARLHGIRRGDRDPKIWNYACDIRINNDLIAMGYTFEGTKPWKSDQISADMPEEDIYDIIYSDPPPMAGPFGEESTDGDLEDCTPEEQRQQLQAVVQAQQAAIRADKAGDIPGHIQTYLNTFLAPIVPWEAALMKFLTDKMNTRYSYRRPNRRHSDIYLPSKSDDDGRLAHLIYYLDVSGSISDDDIIRFNSEVKYIKDNLRPKKLTLVQFDTQIQDIQKFHDHEPFNGLMVTGRGGTCLECVREHIEEHKPTAAIVFSDLFCAVMEPVDTPVIWIAIDNKYAKVAQGDLIHIK